MDLGPGVVGSPEADAVEDGVINTVTFVVVVCFVAAVVVVDDVVVDEDDAGAVVVVFKAGSGPQGCLKFLG